MNRREFTAYRLPDGTSTPQAQELFTRLAKAGLSPRWRMEAPSKVNPSRQRSLLINLPTINADAFSSFKQAPIPKQYLHVRRCQDGAEWIVPIGDEEPLDLRALVAKWAKVEFAGELEIDGDFMPKLNGEYYAKIITDGRPPDSVVVWTAGGFYLKES